MGRKRTTEEVRQIVNNLGYRLIDNYIDGRYRRVTIENEDGYKWDGVLSSLISPSIEISFFHKNNYKTLENISLWLSENRPEFELCEESTYEGSKETTLIIFHNIPECQEKFEASWGHIIRGRGCSVCRGLQVGEKTSLAYLRSDLAKEWHPCNEKSPDEFPEFSNKVVYWICSECDYGRNKEWLVSIDNRTKTGCPACAGKVVTDKNRLSLVRPNIAKEWDYSKNKDTPDNVSVGSHDARWWICPEGHSSYPCIINNRRRGDGCPKCKSSKGEDRIFNWIEENIPNLKNSGIIRCKPQKRFKDCKDKGTLPFDFGFEYSDSTWSVAEFQGEQHFFPIDFAGKGDKWAKENLKEIKRRDRIKKKFCRNNNIPLLIIPYWEFYNIEQILTENLL